MRNKFGIFEDEEIDMLIESSKKGMHKTLEGNLVQIGSQECRDDLERRMSDMSYHRDDQVHGSDARSYYSGVLKVLRRKMRENDKVMNQNETLMKEDDKPSERVNESSDRSSEQAAERILKLAGLI